MIKIRVLVVDDSVVVRQLVSNVLSEDPDIEVVGVAANGRIALAKIEQVNPDVVTLDIEMPVLDGLATLKELRKSHPRLPVIMFSTLTARGGTATLNALSLGASDYVTKPSNVGQLSEAMAQIRDALNPKIKALCAKVLGGHVSGIVAPRKAILPKLGEPQRLSRAGGRPGNHPVEVVTVGVSTGGPNALAEMIPQLPVDLPVPVLIVQHMPPLFTKLLADRLAGLSGLDVREGVDGAVVEPGTVWLAPGDHHMVVRREADTVRLALNQDPPENSCRPAADPLFCSVAEAYGPGTLAVVMTGMGRDGFQGCVHVRHGGGQIVVQDEATSVVWGMPGFVAEADMADRVVPLDRIADVIVSRVRLNRARPFGRGGDAALRSMAGGPCR